MTNLLKSCAEQQSGYSKHREKLPGTLNLSSRSRLKQLRHEPNYSGRCNDGKIPDLKEEPTQMGKFRKLSGLCLQNLQEKNSKPMRQYRQSKTITRSYSETGLRTHLSKMRNITASCATSDPLADVTSNLKEHGYGSYNSMTQHHKAEWYTETTKI